MALLSHSAWAQTNAVSVAPPEQITIRRGGSATQVLKLEVRSGFHVNSNKPKDEFIIPLRLTWNAGPVEAKQVVFPPAEEIKVGGQDLTVFTGKFEIKTEFQTTPSATPGLTQITGKLRYQACNDQMCLRPTTVDIKAPIDIQ